MVDDIEFSALALSLPEAEGGAHHGQAAFSVGRKGFAWGYMARPTPKAKRMPVPGVIAIRCRMETKELLIEAAPERFFDDDHYRGYPAVLVRLAQIDAEELMGLLKEAWRLVAPKAVARRYGV